MGIDDDEDGMEINSSSMVVGPPLLESAHKASQSPSEHAVARFLSCSLKRIDPALQSRQRANGEAKEIAEAKFHCDKLEVPEVPIEDMLFDEGGLLLTPPSVIMLLS
ncbi:hypothetical protein ACB094_01G244900 [Castanea mollissima]